MKITQMPVNFLHEFTSDFIFLKHPYLNKLLDNKNDITNHSVLKTKIYVTYFYKLGGYFSNDLKRVHLNITKVNLNMLV